MLTELSQCIFGYGNRPVVRVEHLRLDAGRCLGIFGPNGSGKTTLVRGMTGLLPAMSGTVHRHNGVRFGYLPQHRTLELHWPMSALDAGAMAVSAHSRFGWVGREARHRLEPMMRTLGVDDLAHRPFAKLSGGQQQRVLLAGALAAEPLVLVLDEPTDGLDVRSRQVLLRVLREATAERLAAPGGRGSVRAAAREDAGPPAPRGLCTVIISHDVEDLLCLCDDVAWLHPGQDADEPSLVELIAPEQLAQRVTQVRQSL